MMKPPRTEKEAVAPTEVFWDIERCPVPDGYDPRRVGPCIKRFLHKLGYSGPVTISAVGKLTSVPIDILRGISSTGIVLHHSPYSSKHINSLVCIWCYHNPPPSNLMVISLPPNFSHMLEILTKDGYNPILPFTYDSSPQELEAAFLWENFLLPDLGAVEEDESASSWFCASCCHVFPRQGFENFVTHLSSPSPPHKKLFPMWYPNGHNEDTGQDKEAFGAGVEAPLDSHPDNAATST